MKRSTRIAGIFVLLMLLIAAIASADPYLGTIYVSDGGTANNINTTCADAGIQGDGGAVVPDGGLTDVLYGGCGFNIPPGAWVTVQCRSDMHVNTDVTTCDTVTCPKISPEQWLSMPVSRTPRAYAFTRFSGVVNYDGGLNSATVNYANGLVSIKPADGGSTGVCGVWVQPESR